MKRKQHRAVIRPTSDPQILEAYLRKTAHSKYDARRIHRQLRKLCFAR